MPAIAPSQSGPSDHPGYVAGYWYSFPEGTSAGSTAIGATDTLYVYPAFLRFSVPISRLTARVATAVAATSMKMAVWRNGSNGRPTGTSIAGNNTALATTSVANVTTATFSPVPQLPAGVYWVGAAFSGGLPTMSSLSSMPLYTARVGSSAAANSVTSQFVAISTPFVATGDITALNLDGATWTGVGAVGVPVVGFEVAP